MAGVFSKTHSLQIHFIHAFAPVAASVESIICQFKNSLILAHGTDVEGVLRNDFLLNCTRESVEAMALPSTATVSIGYKT